MLHSQLREVVVKHCWDTLPALFDNLSNADFRLGGPLLCDIMAQELEVDAYWNLSLQMVSYNAKAFLVTLVKGAVRYNIPAIGDGFSAFCSRISMNPIDVYKTAELLLPTFSMPNEITDLFVLLGLEDAKQRIGLLIRIRSNAAAYVMFHTMKFVDSDRQLLLRVVQYLIKQGGDRNYNFASLLTVYFGLKDVRAQFSLRIEPYQLAWLEGSYDAFCKALGR